MKVGLIATIVISLAVLFVLFEFLYVKYNGTYVPAPTIPRQTITLGKTGKNIQYVVLGDSTSIGQGAQYQASIGPQTAAHLAKNYQVNYTNLGISGATTKDVITKQLSAAVALKPDVVLLAIGANDATHLTSGAGLRSQMEQITSGLIAANCNVKIVLTGSPAMGSVKRFPWPIRQFMGLRTQQINSAYALVIAHQKLTFAYLADKTGVAFAQHPEYFAADNFHPNDAGYATWIPVVNSALDTALATQPSHCHP